ncbi:hypothetical protein EDD37DRAFT_281792 [Exophiala viscosa]|nr:hypothetical protein EDD37DRAFT_281792 [Exophiala viscosa]
MRTSTNSSRLPIPSKALLFHLAQVADFHLNATCSFSDYLTLEKQWNRAHLQSVQSQPDIWQVKLLMVAATGKLFLEKGATNLGPPGIQEFFQCVQAFSAIVCRIQDPSTTIETLCLMAFYAQSADLHTAAHLYIGQAGRLARSYGMDRSAEGSKHQILWWNICVLDQRLAASINTWPDFHIHDENLHWIASDETRGVSPDFRLRVNLAIAHILTEVNKVTSKYERTSSMSLAFVTAVSQQLAALTKVGRSIRTTESLCHGDSLATISRSAATLHLLYCHCIMRACIPFLLHRLTPSITTGQIDGHASINNAYEPVLGMMKVGVNAATLSLNILSALREQSLLEIFAFLDNEVTFLAAVLLVLVNIISPGTTDTSFIEVANGVLQDMASRGNIPAEALKDTLTDICELAAGYSSTHRNRYGRLLTVVKDAETLNRAILNVIDIPQPAIERPEDSAGEIVPPVAELPTASQSTIPSVQLVPAPGRMEPSASFCIDDFDAVANTFDFDTVDLDWLDFV